MLSFKLWEGHLKDIEGVHACSYDIQCLLLTFVQVNLAMGQFHILCLSDFFFWSTC